MVLRYPIRWFSVKGGSTGVSKNFTEFLDAPKAIPYRNCDFSETILKTSVFRIVSIIKNIGPGIDRIAVDRDYSPPMEPIILASGSLRRQEYFRLMGIPFSIMPSNVDETPTAGKNPRSQAEEIAQRKVTETVRLLQDRIPPWVFGADTVISVQDSIYGKPLDREDARRMLSMLSDREHEVITAMALFNGKKKSIDCRSVVSRVRFAPISDAEMEWYLDTGEWQEVAGSYKIQGLGACFISEVHGSYSGIVGLPMREFYVMLRENGYSYASA